MPSSPTVGEGEPKGKEYSEGTTFLPSDRAPHGDNDLTN
jgi:hypothetical protein